MPRTIHAGQLLTADATCPSGKKVTGGGYVLFGTNPPPHELKVLASYPEYTNGQLWRVIAENTGIRTLQYSVYAVCVNAS